jgi:hypothetical protein
MDLHDCLLEINRSLFCEECQRRALDFLEAGESAVYLAGTEPAVTLQIKVEAALVAPRRLPQLKTASIGNEVNRNLHLKFFNGSENLSQSD